MPIKPGVESPPVSSMVLLIIAEYCWVTFGRRLLLLEFAFYCCFLGLLTFATVDRSARYPPIRTKTQGFFVDAFLMASSVLLAVFQWFKTRLVQDVVRGRIWQLSTCARQRDALAATPKLTPRMRWGFLSQRCVTTS